MVLGDGSRLSWLEEQSGSKKTDFYESGGKEKGRRDLGPKWAELKGWMETFTM